jgi:glucan 1,3-beta-glucosidase
VVDEWTFTQYLGQDAARKQLTQHWDTWITEKDIARLSQFGINHVRIPIGYWAFDIQVGEPWVLGAFDYLLKAILWAEKYNIKVFVDLHGAPGSQVSR